VDEDWTKLASYLAFKVVTFLIKLVALTKWWHFQVSIVFSQFYLVLI